ncbi:MAG: type II toxin-antitoxin system RelE/ParE family toxin [Nitrospirae bacterium]|nr:MAG: type II toxin-antitoxin system RelE/ParE family toxin [Nitrospirota bacterium]
MQWTVEYYRNSLGEEPAADFIEELQPGPRAKVLRTIKLLSQYGVLLSEPYTKQLRGKIRELRIRDSIGAVRILYFAYVDKRIVLLHGFIKKTDKTPAREIAVAEKRMQDMIERS